MEAQNYPELKSSLCGITSFFSKIYVELWKCFSMVLRSIFLNSIITKHMFRIQEDPFCSRQKVLVKSVLSKSIYVTLLNKN